MNTTDDDGDTPLYTVENVETARYLVEHGATVDRRNNEGIQVRPASPTRRDPLPLHTYAVAAPQKRAKPAD